MKIKILSDLHWETHLDKGKSMCESINVSNIDVLVIAGDLCDSKNLYKSYEYLSKLPVQVISVFGNHEYWGASPFMIENFKHNIENDFKNIKILDCEKFTYNDVTFSGATLWFQRPLERMYEGRMIDYKQIRDFVPWVYDKAGYTRKWMMSNVSENDVVITHHLPTYESVHWKYHGSPLNEYFVHDVKDIVKSTNPKYWIHGHTHESCSYLYGKTQVIANPYGYRGYETNENFNEEFIIEL